MISDHKTDSEREKHRLFFLRTGIVIAVGLVLIAFDWSTSKEVIKKIKIPTTSQDEHINLDNSELTNLSGSIRLATISFSERHSKTKPQIGEDCRAEKQDEILPDNKDIVTIQNGVYICTDEMPTFPGGRKALYEHIQKEVKNSKAVRGNHCSEKVLVKFVVNSLGEIESASVVKSACQNLDNEALRIIKTLPRWIAGKHNGKCVSVWSYVPICFSGK